LTIKHSITACALGLLLAALTIYGGFIVLGMGHGPDAPIQFSWLALVLYPLAFLRLKATAQNYGWARDFLTGLAALLLVVFGVGMIPQGLAPQVWYIYIFGLLPLAACIALFGALQFYVARFGKHLIVGDVALIIIALALDWAFFRAFAKDMFGPRLDVLFAIWLVFWLGWQIAALVALYRHVTSIDKLAT
jgi:hypothetical protein